MRIVHEGVVKLCDADVLILLMLPLMLAAAAFRLLAYAAPRSTGMMCQ